MQGQLMKWGNSLAVRIPKPLADEAQMKEGDTLEISVSHPGRVELDAVPRRQTLMELVSAITDENRHEEMDWGAPVGREVW